MVLKHATTSKEANASSGACLAGTCVHRAQLTGGVVSLPQPAKLTSCTTSSRQAPLFSPFLELKAPVKPHLASMNSRSRRFVSSGRSCCSRAGEEEGSRQVRGGG